MNLSMFMHNELIAELAGERISLTNLPGVSFW